MIHMSVFVCVCVYKKTYRSTARRTKEKYMYKISKQLLEYIMTKARIRF